MHIADTYDEHQSITPIWQGDVLYHESVMYLEDEFRARLLYTPTEVFTVWSYDYKTAYVRGVDWEVEGDVLIRLPGSRIPAFPLDDYYPTEHVEWQNFACTVPGRPFLKYGEGDTFQKYQVLISYRHNDTWRGRMPESKAAQFARFFDKLSRGEEATVVFYGDSITTGCNSTAVFGLAPYTPSFPYMITKVIADRYGYEISIDADPNAFMKSGEAPRTGKRVLHYVNTAVGGMDSSWGLQNAQERVSAYKPDLLVLAFGMNDGGKPTEEFLRITQETVDLVRTSCPLVDVCLLATMLPHHRAAGFYGYQYTYEAALEAYAEGQAHMAVAPMTSVHAALLEKKEYYTMTGNNINHTNDFLSRVYAMTVLATLGVS